MKNKAKAVEQALRGLPDSIELYVPWNPETDHASWWSCEEGSRYEFPVVHLSMRECEVFIAKETIGVMESVIDGHMDLPGTIETIQLITLSRNGSITPHIGPLPSMEGWVRDWNHFFDEDFNQEIFDHEFATYYAELASKLNQTH